MGAEKDSAFAQFILAPGRKFLSNVPANNKELAEHYTFDNFLKDFADMDDDGTVENVNSEKKQWKKLDAITL